MAKFLNKSIWYTSYIPGAPIPGNLNKFPENLPARPRKNKGVSRETYRETFQGS